MTTSPLLVPLAALARRRHGVFSTAEALDAGLDSYELTRLVRRGMCERLRRGWYVDAADYRAADDAGRHLLRARAVSAAISTPHVLSHSSAAAAHGLPLHEISLDEVHLTHPLSARATRHEARVWHHCGDLEALEVMTVDGLGVTALARTAFDVARTSDPAGALVVADAALARGATPEDYRAVLEHRADWPGSVKASHVLTRADGRSESVGESLSRLAFIRAGFAPDVLQPDVRTDRGEYRTDFGWVERGVLGEFDGKIKYGRLLANGETATDVLVQERERELAIERAGWVVVRFTWAEIFDVRLVRARLEAAFRRAEGRRHAGFARFPST